MWTPRKILLFTFGLILSVSGYRGYLYFLGQYDGLPPLPVKYLAVLNPGDMLPSPIEAQRDPAVRQLVEAFGEVCEERERRIKLGWSEEGLAIAADDYDIEDGDLVLIKVSIAIFGDKDPKTEARKINTIRGDTARIRFDRPLENFGQYRDREIVGGSIIATGGNVVILTDNRSTPTPDDDVRITTKTLNYSEPENLIWTKDRVDVADHDPFVASVWATGMRAYLRVKQASASPGSVREKVSGIRLLQLLKDIRMVRYIDGRSGFLAGGGTETDTTSPPKKSQLTVECTGPFDYEFDYYSQDHDRARFQGRVEVLRADESKAARSEEVSDILKCDKLELRFYRAARPENGRPERVDNTAPVRLVAAKATGRNLELQSNSEQLVARGTELIYEVAGEQSNRTMLIGDPRRGLEALKNGNKIDAWGRLILENKGENVSSLVVDGRGTITLVGENGNGGAARWYKKLTYSKQDKYDHLALEGRAGFADRDARELSADNLDVWMEPESEKNKPKDSGENDLDTVNLQRVLARGSVKVRSPELIVDDCNRFEMAFVKGEPRQDLITPNGPPVFRSETNGPVSPQIPLDSEGLNNPESDNPGGHKAPPPPVYLTARNIDAKLTRLDAKSELRSVHATERVHVRRDAENSESKAFDIQSNRLVLERTPRGDKLQIYGPEAVAKFDALTIAGPEIVIDQADNVAFVNGAGWMKQPIWSDLEGKKLEQPVTVTAEWEKEMKFFGQDGWFRGDVRVTQGEARLYGQELQLILTEPVSFKNPEGKGDSKPQLWRFYCIGDAWFDRTRYDGKQVDYEAMKGALLDYDNTKERLKLSGPEGQVRFFKPGNSKIGMGRSDEKQRQSTQMMVTDIRFNGRMEANKKTGKVTFDDGVDLIHMPADDPRAVIPQDRLPGGALRIQCNRLDVLQTKLDGDKTNHEFRASDNVTVEYGDRFTALAGLVTYDEQKGLLVFHAARGQDARLYRLDPQRGRTEPFVAERIFYNLETGDVSTHGLKSFGRTQ